jgi:hypothetical protein
MNVQAVTKTKESEPAEETKHIIFSGDIDEECLRFLKKHKEAEKILEESVPVLAEYFGTPLNVVLEIFPDNTDSQKKMIGWIKSTHDIAEGLKRFDQFEDWYIAKNFDLLTDDFNFSIEFAEAEAL